MERPYRFGSGHHREGEIIAVAALEGVTDVSGRTNIAGAGINMAQRVMDSGGAGLVALGRCHPQVTVD